MVAKLHRRMDAGPSRDAVSDTVANRADVATRVRFEVKTALRNPSRRCGGGKCDCWSGNVRGRSLHGAAFGEANRRVNEIQQELERLETDAITEQNVSDALAEFESLWEALKSRERSRIIELLIERIELNGTEGRLDITFHPTGIKTLMVEREEVAA